MPALDGTGPNGQGPRTGRGLGNCPGCGGILPKLSRRGRGLGLGIGLGRNRKNNVTCCPLCPLCQQQQDLADKQSKEDKKETVKKDN